MESTPPEESLEGPVEENTSNPLASKPAGSSSASAPEPDSDGKKPKLLARGIQGLITRINIYLLLFIFIVVLAGVVVFIGMQRSKKEGNVTLNTQELSKDELAKLSNSNAKVGDPKQTLSIESNAIFAGKVLLRDSLDVAGSLRVGGGLTLPSINVSGSSTFDQIQGNKLSIAGDGSIQGQLNVQKNLVVAGGASFGGPISAPQITISSLQLNGDLVLNRHIDAGGATPGRSNGTALGSGGTTSIGGTDTAGTLTINTGGSPGAGCFATINFVQKFGDTPHVVITPVGSAAAGLNYYVNRSNSSFSVCTTNPAPAGQSFSFDYIVID